MEKQIAKLNYLRIAPRKVRSITNLIKGLSVNEAEAQLLVQARRPARHILKLLRSAVSNAKNNKRISIDNLYIETIFVDGGPMLKRFMPRARGTAAEIQKKMSHVTIILAEAPAGKAPRFKISDSKKVKAVKEKKSVKVEKAKKKTEEQDVVKTKKAATEGKSTSKKTLRRKVI